MVRLVVGLGNPGRRYARTRHNLGFVAVDALRERLQGGRWQRRGEALLCRVGSGGQEIVLAKPQTFMNNSGVAVEELVRSFGLAPAEVVLVHDDLDLPVGRIRLRPGGSAGGHRGVASVLAALGTEQVGRVKIGIGRPPAGVDPADYVLAPLSGTEWEALAAPVATAAAALEFLLKGGSWEEAMNRFNSARSGCGPS